MLIIVGLSDRHTKWMFEIFQLKTNQPSNLVGRGYFGYGGRLSR